MKRNPAGRRSAACWRFLLLARALLRLAPGLRPPYSFPSALALAYRMRSASRRFPAQGAHRRRFGSDGVCPHFKQSPRAMRPAVCRRERSRS